MLQRAFLGWPYRESLRDYNLDTVHIAPTSLDRLTREHGDMEDMRASIQATNIEEPMAEAR